MLRNTADRYGLVTRSLHWLLALAMFALIGVGWYVVDAGYYYRYYELLLDWHQLVGVLVGFVGLALVLWHVVVTRPPRAVAGLHGYERIGSHVVRLVLYAALLTIPISGWLMTTGEDGPLDLMGLVTLPAPPEYIAQHAATALEFHYYASYAVLGIASFHALAALKHHFVDRNAVLRRMLRGH